MVLNMAYGHSQIHGITNPPSIEAFSFALADMIGKDENAEVGMTSNGQLVRQVDVPERKTGWTNLGGWLGSGETFKDCQENLERYLDFHSQQKRLADRKITVVSTAPKMNLKTVGELFSQITVADNTPFKDDVPIYSNDALNGPFPEAARIRKGDVDELLRLLHEKSAIPLGFEDVKAAHRQSLLDLYKFDQEAVVDLRDLLQTRDMKDPYQKTVAMTQLEGLLNRFNKRFEAAATDHTPAGLPPKNIDPSTGMRDVSEPEPTRPRRRAELRESGGHSPKGASVVPERPGFEDRIAELSHQAEAISNVYQGARDAVALLNIIDEMWPIDANLAGQLLDYWVTRDDFPVTEDQAYRCLHENRPLSTLLAEPPAKEALADKVVRARGLKAEATRLSSVEHYTQAFSAYRDVVQNHSRDEAPDLYDTAVRGMADIWLEAGALPTDYKTLANRGILVTHMSRLAVTDEIIRHQLGLITPKAAPRQSRRASPPEPVSRPPQEVQRPGTQNRPHGIPVEPMQMNRRRLFEYELDGKKRLADREQQALEYPELEGVDGKRVVNRVTDEQVRMLEYRVVDDHQEVRRKIERANHTAADHQRGQNSGDEKYRHFEPERTLGMAKARKIHEFHSQEEYQVQGAGLATAAGDRGINEDAHLVTRFEFRAGNERIPVALAGVLDGHGGILPRNETEGGKYYSDRVADQLVPMVRKRLEQYNEGGLTEAGVWNALKLAMVDLGRMEVTAQGTTACTVLAIKDRLWTVNVGDSRALLELPEGECLQLSEDQTPDGAERGTQQIPGKYARSSIKRGGEPDERRMRGPQRSGSLGPARSMGEHLLQGAISSRGKITSQPITDDVRRGHLMIGCDGIFDVATSEQVVQLMRTQRQRNPGVTNEELAAEIVAHAFEAKSLDNLSAMVIPVASMLTA